MIALHVAISDDGGIFKHWVVFLEAHDPASDPDDPDDLPSKAILQAMGSDRCFRFDPVLHADPRTDPHRSLLDLVHLADVPTSIPRILRLAEQQVPIHNDVSGWNCQDFVMDLLDVLEEQGLVDGTEERYALRKEELKGKVEGWQ